MTHPVRVIDAGRPNSRLGTPAHTGPYSRLRVDTGTKLRQGSAVFALLLSGQSIREAARTLRMSRMTAWRRVWFLHDYVNGGGEPIPHQRSTRAVPRGEPWLLPRDAEAMLRQLLDTGPEISADVIFASVSTVPRCVREQALRILVAERMTVEEFDRLEASLASRAQRRPQSPAPSCMSPALISQSNRFRL